jgi:spermidine/putrescine transport system permease protein
MNKSSFARILAIPALSWLLFFIFAPLFFVGLTSFLTRGTYGSLEFQFQIGNYFKVFSQTYFEIFLRSLSLATVTTILCLLIALPMAWAICTAKSTIRNLLIALVAIPFLMNLIIRVYAIRLFVGIDGPLLNILNALGIENDPFSFSQNQYLVIYGMITSYLPFMIFPLYSALEKFDFSLVEATYDLGGTHKDVLFKILIPMLRPAIASGCLMVFVPALGEFVIPDLLGGAKTMLAGNLITEQFLKSRDWPLGAALSVVLMLILFVFAFVFQKWGAYGKK